MKLHALLLSLASIALTPAAYAEKPIEAPAPYMADRSIALTLDACSGDFDRAFAEGLVAQNVRSTIFVTARWIARHPDDIQYLKAHRDLFDIENHGAEHKAPTLGSTRGPYGVPAVATLEGLDDEVNGGEKALEGAFGTKAHWFRGATALYSPEALERLHAKGWQVAGYSVPLDDGASLPANKVEQRALSAKPGDVLIGHINHPRAGTREGVLRALPELKRRGLHFGWLPVSAADTASVPSGRTNV